MRKFILPVVLALGIGSAAPALAFDSGDQVSMQAALDVATDIGIRTVAHTQFLGEEWQIQGRDRTGRWMATAIASSIRMDKRSPSLGLCVEMTIDSGASCAELPVAKASKSSDLRRQSLLRARTVRRVAISPRTTKPKPA